MFPKYTFNICLFEYCKRLLYTSHSRKRTSLISSLVVHLVVKHFCILCSPKQFDSTYLRARDRRRMTIMSRNAVTEYYYLAHSASCVYWNWINMKQQTFHLKIIIKATKKEFPSQHSQFFWHSRSQEWAGYFFSVFY